MPSFFVRSDTRWRSVSFGEATPTTTLTTSSLSDKRIVHTQPESDRPGEKTPPYRSG